LTDEQLDQQCINTIRTLSIDAIQQAKSGHPGTLMALAPLVYTIWNRVLRFDPQDPIWPNRDRFVLSNGHASMLLWSALHLTKTRAVNAEYEILGQPAVTLEDIHHFRQLNSKAAGRCLRSSVIGWPSGTRQSLLDLRQQSHLARGKHALAFTEDVASRFLAYGWKRSSGGDANDIDRIEGTLGMFVKTKDRPTFIVLDSHIGYGSPHKQDTAAAHGDPLGDEEVRLTKRNYGWPENEMFLVPTACVSVSPKVLVTVEPKPGARGENCLMRNIQISLKRSS